MSESRPPAENGTLAFRVGLLEGQMKDIRPDALVAEVKSLRAEMRTIRQMLWTIICALGAGGGSLIVMLITRTGG